MKDIDIQQRLSSPQIHEAITKEGNEELERPVQSLLWSATVAGICISFSLFCEAFIKINLPSEGNYFLIENFGYTIGFIIVILCRFQLFTENTITVILPLLERHNWWVFKRTMRLWAVVFFFNMVGTFLVALLTMNLPFFSAEQVTAMIDISDHAVNKDLSTIFFTAIPAGFLIAALVWMMPSIQGAKFWLILLITYIIAIGDFAHVVAGSAEAFLLILNDSTSLMHGLGYILFAGLGNIVGGTVLFTFMAYAQIKEEI